VSARELRGRTPNQQILGWRAATAARVFVLALATGLTLSARAFGDVGVLLAGLVVIAAIASTLDAYAPPVLIRLIPVAEGVLTAALISSTSGTIGTLLPYFIAPPLAAGIRAGWVTCLNGGLATLVMLGAVAITRDNLGVDLQPVRESLTWLAVGVAAGLLASLQTRSMRRMEEAHRLMAQLHAVSQELAGGLDSASAGDAMVREIMVSGAASRVVLFVESQDGGLSFLAADEDLLPTEEELAAANRARKSRRIKTEDAGTVFPVRVGEHGVGVLLVAAAPTVSASALERAVTPIIETHSVPLDTALLFDEVREVATTEERQRLARDIHDGVAQDVASLGYVIDELAASSTDPKVRAAAVALRAEITRVVSELRHSIFDLRAERGGDADLGLSVRACVDQSAMRSGFLGHVHTDLTGPPLPARVQAELLRITQEAISNVRKHADAENVWVTLTTDGNEFALSVIDDGRGTGMPRARAGHYGLHTMRERAARIDATLDFGARPGGGTSVRVRSANTPSIHESTHESTHDLSSQAPERNLP
jgi:signal transduction histidine kinase